MARTKQTTRRYRVDGSFYHSDSETVNSNGSIRVPASEISEHPPNPSSDLPQTPTYYSSPSSSGTPSDTILREADIQYQAEPSKLARGGSRGDKAMEKVSGTRKPTAVSEAKYRSNVLNRASDEQKTVGTPKSGSTRPSPSKLIQPKIQKTGARSKITELKAEIKGLKEKLEPLQEAKKEAERAKERVSRLEVRLANQEKQLKSKFKSRAEEEKEALVKQMMEDYEAIMRMA
ncbi:dynactin subunit 1-like [Chenopodium quinoa]|uniref:dynactin subunit 1-like n=1 Tax=Chenopodium quinoa TaxID=63459 RepID=UPI000B778E25|nr:dynactin subunit 1-like [Chenopodium quinoa]